MISYIKTIVRYFLGDIGVSKYISADKKERSRHVVLYKHIHNVARFFCGGAIVERERDFFIVVMAVIVKIAVPCRCLRNRRAPRRREEMDKENKYNEQGKG